jgi:ElaB/YqjD/DUF883 family membrane-anchored ribosome-binding protein
MTLKRALAAITDVDEALRSLYVEKDGQFVLDVEGGDDLKAAGTQALANERKARAAAEKALKDLKAQLGDMDPVKAKEAIRIIAELEEKNLLGEGKFEEAVAKRVERIAAEGKTREDALNSETKGLRSQLEELLIDNGIQAVAIKAGIIPTAVDDAVRYAKTIWRLKEGKPVPMKGDDILYGKEPNQPMTMDEWISERAKDRPHWFGPSSGGGATGSAQNGRAAVGGTITLSREQAKDRAAYLAAKEQAEKAGAQLVIQQ